MSLSNKVKTALDETRLLILGAQVLFGFQLHGVFQESFGQLALPTRLLNCAGQALMALALGLLIAPSMQHRIVERGEDTRRIARVATGFAGAALVPFAISLGLGFYIVFHHLYGGTAALIAGIGFCLLAGFFWFVLEFVLKSTFRVEPMQEQETPAPLSAKIDQMLTEARVILPGGQALLGFQLTVILTQAFERLPESSKLLHVAALCCVALSVILLMTPAALHRITFGGADAPAFFKIGSAFVIAAPIPLAFGIAGDLYVATAKASESPMLGLVLAATIAAALAILWYAVPLYLRMRAATAPRP
jgi:hypothetical protein